MPSLTVTEMDRQGLPGALVAVVMLNMGIGELRAMTRVSRIGIAVTNHRPPKAIRAWDLLQIIDSTPAH